MGLPLQSLHHLILILLNLLLLLFQLQQLGLVYQNLVSLVELRSQFDELLLVFTD
jgi:hypothetical protein